MQTARVRFGYINTCKTEGCTNKCKYNYCGTCSSRKTRAKNPLRAYFYHLRNRAKQRPKDFSLTMEEWLDWCKKNDFEPYKNDSVDRIDNKEGYHIWNIQKLPLIENVNKYHQVDKIEQYQSEYKENPF